MKSNFKKIIIVVVILVILILLFMFVSKKSPDVLPNLTSSTDTSVNSEDAGTAADDFLTWLLSVKSINLDNSIFSDPAFASLNDSSILLTPDGTEGRPNPFAPIGVDVSSVVSSDTSTSSTLPNIQKQDEGNLPVKPVTPKSTN